MQNKDFGTLNLMWAVNNFSSLKPSLIIGRVFLEDCIEKDSRLSRKSDMIGIIGQQYLS